MNFTTSSPTVSEDGVKSGLGLGWLLLLMIPAIIAYYWNTTHGTLKNGEPPLVPYWFPWLGHGLSFMADINKFVTGVR